MKRMFDFLPDSSGATAVEYGILAALVAVALIAGMTGIGSGMYNVMIEISNSLVTP
jgi:pilus assembly protein Flp/PilA